MTITLYTNTSSPNTMKKSISAVSGYENITGVLRDETSIVHPVVQIEGASFPANANYMYIAEFGRYYFISNPRSVRNNLWEFDATSDPFYTYRGQIASCGGIVKRSASAYNVMLDDGSFKTYADPIIRAVEFPAGFTTKEYVLAVAGS